MPSNAAPPIRVYVVQRRLFPAFLEAYLPVVGAVRFGHPLAVEDPDDPLPELDFGPVIHSAKASDLSAQFDEAVHGGGIPLFRGSVGDGRFLDVQDTSAYVAPACVLQPPASWSLHHAEPFGPLDSVVLVDTQAELLAAMNASNGSLVASIATDDPDLGSRLAEEVQAFKVGINKPRSRGDRDEVFGGLGASWKGAFVGGTCSSTRSAAAHRASTRSSTATSRHLSAASTLTVQKGRGRDEPPGVSVHSASVCVRDPTHRCGDHGPHTNPRVAGGRRRSLPKRGARRSPPPPSNFSSSTVALSRPARSPTRQTSPKGPSFASSPTKKKSSEPRWISPSTRRPLNRHSATSIDPSPWKDSSRRRW